MTITESLDELLSYEAVAVVGFYRIFLHDYPEVQPFFHKTDIELQAVVLTQAINVIVLHHTRRYPVMDGYLRSLGRSHKTLNIAREHYPKFVDSLLKMLREFHGGIWDDDLEGEWTAAINSAVDVILSEYDD